MARTCCASAKWAIGNTTIAAAINLALYGGTAADWVGPGTGSEGDVLARKIAAVEKAVALHGPHLADPLEVLRRLAGREIAAMAGAILAARMQKVPLSSTVTWRRRPARS